MSPFLTARIKASSIHLGASMLVAALAGALVFLVWYPYPYSEFSDGRDLFKILIFVDVALGPLLTLAVFNIRKPRFELRRDIGVIVLIQAAALVYGLWVVAQARPVLIVFEYDRLRVVHAVDIPPELLSRAPKELQEIPIFGRQLRSLRPFKDSDENFEAVFSALQGLNLAARPELWQPYTKSAEQIRLRARPASELISRFPAESSKIRRSIAETGFDEASLLYLPLVSRKHFWTALLDARTLDVVGFVPVDSF